MRISVKEALKLQLITPDQASLAHPKKRGGRSASRPRDAEGSEQADLIKLVRAAFPKEGALLIHIPNGGSRKNAFEGWRLKEQGVRAGVSDLFLPIARGGFHGLWIEFKASPPYTARVTPTQEEWIELMIQQNYKASICIGIDSAFEEIKSYLSLPKTD